MDGAGIMNLPTDVGGPTGQAGLDSYAPLIAAQSTARDMGYPRFTRELLSAGSEMNPAEVQEFLQELRAADLQPEDIAILRRVVEAVFNDPNNYPQVREQLLAEGVPEDILPETFDLEFFVALRIATEEAENLVRESRPTGQEAAPEVPMQEGMGQGIPAPPVEMARGGIAEVPQMNAVARELAGMGRNGDTMLAHITPQEAVMLKRMGGSGTINPYTGLPEFFFKQVFKAVGGALKSVGKAVKKFASSTVGRVITTVALGAFMGPAAAGLLGVSSAAGMAAVSGFVGSFGSGLLAGDGLQASLRSGLTGAAFAGGLSALSGGSAALQARPELQQAFDQRGFFGTVSDTTKNFFGSPVDETKRLFGTGEPVAQAGPTGPVGTAAEIQATGAPPATEGAFGRFDSVGQAPVGQSLPGFPEYQFGTQGPVPNTAGVSVPTRLDAPFFEGDVSVPRPTAATTVATPATTGAAAITPKAAAITPGAESTFLGRTGDFLSKPSLSSFGDIFVDPNATGIARYKPALYAGGIGLLATNAGSLFEVPEVEQPDMEAYDARRAEAVAKFKAENPEFFGSLAPTSYPTQTAMNVYTPPGAYATQPTIPIRTYQPTYYAAKGSGPEGVENFPRKNGHISGPGTGTSDDIPAMLSDGEFVFTAQAVRNMGGGSRRKGAAKMYKLMKMLEGGPVGKTAKA